MESRVRVNINLLPPKNRARVPKIGSLGIMLLALMGIVFAYLYMSQSREVSSQQAENMKLKAAINSNEEEMTVFKPLQEVEQEMTIKSEEVAAIEKNRVSYAEIINELDTITPPQITIVGTEIKAPKVVVNGFSPDHSNVSRMLEGIKASPIFTKVALLSSEMNENTNQVKITIEIEWEAAKK